MRDRRRQIKTSVTAMVTLKAEEERSGV